MLSAGEGANRSDTADDSRSRRPRAEDKGIASRAASAGQLHPPRSSATNPLQAATEGGDRASGYGISPPWTQHLATNVEGGPGQWGEGEEYKRRGEKKWRGGERGCSLITKLLL